MLHLRQWYIRQADTAQEAAELIKQYQNECFGLRVGVLLFINDSTDIGIREYAVIDEKRSVQIDSWTTEWMSKREIENSVVECLETHTNMSAIATYVEFQSSMIVDRPLN